MKMRTSLFIAFVAMSLFSYAQLNSIPVGSSYNIYSTLLDEQNQVAYDSDLDAVTIVHRQNDGTAGGSGGISFYSSLDGGDTWGGQYIVTPDFNAGTAISSGNRYPSVTIYNPSGNTNPSNAYAVMQGPALNPGAATWGYNFAHSARLTDGANVCEDYYTNSPAIDDFHPYSLITNSNGEMWSISTTLIGGPTDYAAYNLNKGVFNSTTNCVDWTVAETINPSYVLTNGENASGFGWSIAFGPDGSTGYAVHLSLETTGLFNAIQPSVYKTTDFGATWNRLPDFDFSSLSAFSSFLVPTSSGDYLPFFSSVDAVVDGNNRLHLTSEVLSRSNSGVDSLYFIWTGPSTSGIFATSTSDGTDWDAFLIDDILIEDGAVGAVAHGPRAQIARSANGAKIFYSWSKSDETIVPTNDLPDLWLRALDVPSGLYTSAQNVTVGSAYDGIIFYPSIAPIVIETGSVKDYEVAVMYSDPGISDLNPVDYFFLQGAGFDDTDWTIPACASTPILSADVSATSLNLNWTPVPGSFGCRVNYGPAAGSFIGFQNVIGAGVSSVSVPLAVIPPGNFKLRVACGCGTPSSPTLTPFSNIVVITSPSPRYDLATASLAEEVVMPNPSSGQFNLAFNSEIEDQVTLVLHNMLGEVVLQQTVNVAVGKNLVTVDGSDLTNGIYLLQLGNTSSSQLIEIQR